jgi:2-isopropylmalate synthase
VIKAFRKGDPGLADAVYSGVPASLFGMAQVIEVGPMSGKSNVLYWLEKHGIAANEKLAVKILDAAKNSPCVLADEQILALCREASQS